MCCYKLVRIKFQVFGLETKVQQFIDKVFDYLLLLFLFLFFLLFFFVLNPYFYKFLLLLDTKKFIFALK